MTQPDERVLRLLHLEDNDLDHELVIESLRTDLPWQLEVRRAEDEASFLHELQTFSPHLILSDYALPSYDGLRAFRAAEAHDPFLPFLIVTGAMGEEIAVDTLRQGVTDYILKQRLERLAPSVRRAIAEYDAQRRQEMAEQAVRELNLSLQQRLEEVERLRGVAEAQRQRLEVQAQQLSEALTMQQTFLAETSHELRTPLTALLGYLHRQEREKGPSQTLSDARRVAENMTRLVNDLLQISRGELVQDIEMHFVNLDRLVEQVGRDFQVQARLLDRPLEVLGDPGRLTQVLVNLVGNAVRVCGTPDKVTLEARRSEGFAEVHIIDQGPGVPDEIKPRIFDKFYRGKEAGSAGLGLTIAQQVIIGHDGQIDVVDTPGGGATFRVRLPLLEEEDEVWDAGELAQTDLLE
ncbi:response regulator receiver sensor signal transduction histidine kinase [Deinococcus proteolyticus MRP]|uniref:histidine kinase n=1 Tax=Deinococcus proteolyticus (strain ATCC 35074 / DSM 20540 / JCM 6276 / NBRC 101906 / NCIMB 13154 / VKM Ac-1939 / CCM 2703 / MRP) TaxID=693977 RepID=F0RN71_DEIPM|nr:MULTISPECIES: hybrid sensor histidine kinase/response regulator [Deinococcus]ADY26213.1 response regulator receiver sensor signal transduction histidine kinase [Deinococcus proteolyticus MRP]MCY1702328.1 hybrid sensor histidine kinase/response regulator [Deinococcus sp. SL84]